LLGRADWVSDAKLKNRRRAARVEARSRPRLWLGPPRAIRSGDDELQAAGIAAGVRGCRSNCCKIRSCMGALHQYVTAPLSETSAAVDAIS